MKKILLSLFLLSVIFILGCENIDLSKVSDKDLERISEQVIKCEKPYMRFGTSCCLDQNENKICDRDEKISEVVKTIPSEEKLTEESVPESFLPEKCILAPGLACVSHKVEPDKITLVIANGLGRTIKITNVQVGSCSGSFDKTIMSGDEDIFTLTNCRNGAPYEAFEENITLGYTEVQTGLTKTTFGQITTKIEGEYLPNKCALPAGIACIDFLATPDGIALVLQNGLGFDIDKVSVDISGCGSGIKGVDYGNYLASENKDIYAISCSSSLTGSTFSGDIVINYRNTENDLTYRVEGTLSGAIEKDKSIAKFLPAECTLQAGIVCLDYKATSNSLTVVLQNSLGFDITIDDVKAGKCTPAGSQGVLANGAKTQPPITLTCTGIAAGASKFSEDINVIYTVTDTGIQHNNRGQITTRIE